MIVDLPRWERDGRGRPPLPDARYVAFAELGRRHLVPTPEVVLSPLLGRDFDAVEIATRLAALGYRGPYRALSGPLPDAEAVREEVRGAAPELDFDLILVTPPPSDPV